MVKFLGVMVDEDLTFKQQIDYISKKVSTAIGFMFRGKPVLERPQLISLYNTLVLPHLSYCNLIWAINFSTHINRLYLLQKRAARVILNLSYRDHVSNRFPEINIKPLTDIRDLKCLVLTYKIKHQIAPISIKKLMEWKTPDITRPQLRNSGPIIVPFARTVYRQQTFRVYAAKLFNNLNALHPIDLNVSISTYKKTLKAQISFYQWN